MTIWVFKSPKFISGWLFLICYFKYNFKSKISVDQKNWFHEIFEDLIEHNYYRVESIRMQGMVLSVFAKRKLLNQIRHVKSDWIGTGYANFWGNKGIVSYARIIGGYALEWVWISEISLGMETLTMKFFLETPYNTKFRIFFWSVKTLVMERLKRSCFNSFGNKWSFIGNYKYTSSSWYRTGPISS